MSQFLIAFIISSGERFVTEGKIARGTVVTHKDQKAVLSGKVVLRILSVRYPKLKMEYQTAHLQGGSFTAELKYQGQKIKTFYIPSAGYDDCESEEKKLH